MRKERFLGKAARIIAASTIAFATVEELRDYPDKDIRPSCSYLEIKNPQDDKEIISEIAPVFWVPKGDSELERDYQFYAYQIVHLDDENIIVTLTLLFKNDLGNRFHYEVGNKLNIDFYKLVMLLPFKINNGSHPADAETVKFFLKKDEDQWIIDQYQIHRHGKAYLHDRFELQCSMLENNMQPDFVLERGKHGIHNSLDSCNTRSSFFGIVVAACSRDKQTTINPNGALNVGEVGRLVNVFEYEPLASVFPGEDSRDKRFCGGYEVEDRSTCVGKYEWER